MGFKSVSFTSDRVYFTKVGVLKHTDIIVNTLVTYCTYVWTIDPCVKV